MGHQKQNVERVNIQSFGLCEKLSYEFKRDCYINKILHSNLTVTLKYTKLKENLNIILKKTVKQKKKQNRNFKNSQKTIK